MDYRVLDKKAEDLRSKGAELAAKGDAVTPEERDALMTITGQLNELDELRVAARDEAIEHANEIVRTGSGAGAETADKATADAFRSFMKTGSTEARAALVAGTDANGGYIVPEPVHGPLIEKYRKINPLLNEATVFPMSGDTTMYLPYKNAHGVVGNAAEAGARAEQTEPTVANGSLVAYDYFTDQRAAQTWLDSVDGGEDMMLGWIYEDFAEQFGTDLAVGSGITKAKGIFASTATYGTLLSGAAGAIANTAFLTQFFGLQQKYRSNAKWYMSPATLGVALGLAMPNMVNTPLVDSRSDGFYILGKKVVECDDAPAIGAAAFPVAFGDLKKGYAVGIHKNTTILRDPYTATPLVRFYGVARMGGVAWDPSAVTLMKSNNA